MSIRRQIRRYGREMLAAIGLIALGLLVAAGILSQQSFRWPWEDFYEIKAELSSAQAVTPGQGQTVTISGVKVGDITAVELDDGNAVVTLKIEERYAPIYADATMLLRPRTGLKDMQVQLDPGTPEAGELADGATLPQAQTLPDVNPDEVLAALDTDTRAYLSAAVDALGSGLEGSGRDLRRLLEATQPTAAQARRITATLASRRREIRALVHNLNLVAGQAGRHEREIGRTVEFSSRALAALAGEDERISESLARLPGTLDAATGALRSARPLAAELEPAARELTPALRELDPALGELRPLVEETTPVLRDGLRPLVSSAIPVLRQLRPAAGELRPAAAELPEVVDDANYVVNALLNNPEGADEGYSYWVAWFFHNAASMLSTQDAHGAVWRGLALFDCSSLQGLESFIPKTGLPLQIPDPGSIPAC